MTLARAHRLAVFSVAAWGFIALLVTGDFSPMLIGLCCGLVVAAYLSPSGRSPATLMLWNLLTMLVFVGIVLIARQSLLDAAVYFFMYLQIAKLFTAHSARDTLWIYVIAFFHVIGTAVLTTSIAFAVVFLVYVALMASSMLLFTIHRGLATPRHGGMKAASAQGWLLTDPDLAQYPLVAPVVNRQFVLGSGLLSFMIVLTSIGFFMVIPRLTTESLFRTDFGHKEVRDSASAFSETVEFGAFNKIHLDASVALYVEPLDKQQPDYVRLRAVSLDNFDGQRWRRSISSVSGQPFSRFSREQVRFERGRYRMIQPPGITNFIFAPSFPDDLQIELLPHVIFDSVSNSAWLPRTPTREMSYTVISRVQKPELRQDPLALYPPEKQTDGVVPESGATDGSRTQDEQGIQKEGAQALRNLVTAGRGMLDKAEGNSSRHAPPDRRLRPGSQHAWRQGSTSGTQVRMWQADMFRLPSEIRSSYLQVPSRMDSSALGQLASEWVRDAATPFEKARRIENRLRTDYRYSLETGPVPKGNFVEHFLFQAKEGHCEYFATSMVMMLRTIGIPARIVNGYYSVEWSGLSRVFTVRQRDAHSWVEAYFENYGWMTFDPTPPGGVGRRHMSNALLRWIDSLLDVARVRWYRHMIDYDYTNQIGIVRGVLRLARRTSHLLDQWQAGHPGGVRSDVGRTARVAGMAVVALAFVALCVALVRAAATIHRRPRVKARTSCRGPTSRFYSELLHRLKRLGYVRLRSETPREFASRVARTPGLEPVGPITESYYGERYAAIRLSQEELRTVETLLRSVRPG